MGDGLVRLTEPLVRDGGKLRPASWEEALTRAAAGFEIGSGLPSAVFGGVEYVQMVVGAVQRVQVREAGELFGWHVEGGIFHAEGIEKALLKKSAERGTGNARDQNAEHIAAHLIHPTIAGLGE